MCNNAVTGFRFQWVLVVLMWLFVGAWPAFGAEAQGSANGQKIYEARCAGCHGASGKGDGWKAKLAWLKVPDFANAAYMQTRSDDLLFQKIKAGSPGGMPSYTLEFSDSDIKSLVVYIRNFTKTSGPSKPVGASR